MSTLELFDHRKAPGFAKQVIGEGKVFITIASAGGPLKNIIVASAPITSVSISNASDTFVNKALSGDFMIASFGERPVNIRVTGVTLLSAYCSGSHGVAMSLPAFYEKYGAGSGKQSKITIGFGSASGSGSSYRCVLMQLERQQSSDKSGVVQETYTMQLVGVAL